MRVNWSIASYMGKPFVPQFHLGQEVTEVARQASGRFFVRTSAGTQFDAAAVIMWWCQLVPAAPAQRRSFARIEGPPGCITRFRGSALFASKDIIIASAGKPALDWVLALQDKVNSLILLPLAQFCAMAESGKWNNFFSDGECSSSKATSTHWRSTGNHTQSISVRMKGGVTSSGRADHRPSGGCPKLGPDLKDWSEPGQEPDRGRHGKILVNKRRASSRSATSNVIRAEETDPERIPRDGTHAFSRAGYCRWKRVYLPADDRRCARLARRRRP